MARIPYRIGDIVFPTKSAAREAIRTVLYRYEIGQTLQGEDAAFIARVLANHPEVERKVGCGVASFQVESNGPTRGFWLTRTDGSRTDFSFLSCLTPPTAAQESRAGFRTEVWGQILAFRDGQFAHSSLLPCAVTGEVVTVETCHIDHDAPTFHQLVDAFLTGQGIAIEHVEVEATRDGSTETRLADRALAAAWYRFHQQNARLRVVSRRANLSLLRRRSQ